MIVEATFEHVLAVMTRMRATDRFQLALVWGEMTPLEYARKRCEIDGVRLAILDNGIPVAIVGVEDLGGDATLWMVATEAFPSHYRRIYATAKRMTKACFNAGHTLVRAYVLEGFAPGERTMERLGFQVMARRKLGVCGQVFSEFGRTA